MFNKHFCINSSDYTLENIHSKLIITIIPEIIINMPAILLTHPRPSKSSFFLKSVVTELSTRNHKPEPINTPPTRADAEKLARSLPKPRAANTARKTKIVNGFVRVIKNAVKYVLNIPLLFTGILGSAGIFLYVLIPRKRSRIPPASRIQILWLTRVSEIIVSPKAAIHP